MVKKKGVGGFLERFFESMLESVEDNFESFIEKFANVVVLKKLLAKYVVYAAFSIVALIMVFYGVGEIVSSYYPGINKGYIFIGLGILSFLMGFIYKKNK